MSYVDEVGRKSTSCTTMLRAADLSILILLEYHWHVEESGFKEKTKFLFALDSWEIKTLERLPSP